MFELIFLGSYTQESKKYPRTKKKNLKDVQFVITLKPKENLNHLLWKCPGYQEARDKWKMKMGRILKKVEYQKIIQGWNTNVILNLISKQEIFETL